ncbi:MAG: chemotaxis protein CheW, partial [bacterium]
GRGVGMTIVKKFVSSIGGRIIVESPLITGAGTRFTLELPLSLAIINALLVEVSGQVMAVPFGNVERSVMIPSADIKRLGDREVAVLGERDIPLSRLRMIEPRGSQKEEKDFELVVIMKRGEDNIGFVVDRLVEEQEIIVKPLAPILRRIKGFSGSTILGDGRTVLVVDVVGLLENQSLLQL